MKKITLFAFLLGAIAAHAQNAPITFETGQPGATWNWTTFENPSTPAPPLEIVANPAVGGINTSATVAKLTPLVGSPPYAGVESQHATSIGTFTLSTSNAIVQMMVYKSVISDVGIKFATATGESTGEIKVANTVVNQWELLTFDFSGVIGVPATTNIDQIIIFPDFQTRTTDNICYFDNITFSTATTPPAVPMVAAPTPTLPAADVLSMFSNAYTNVAVDTWQTSWSVGTLTDLQVAGNDTKRYSALSFVGVETTGTNLINATSMLYFHVDVWTPNMTAFRIKLVDFGANGIYQGTPNDDVEHELTFTPVINQWNSYHIPMSDFTGLITRGHIAQLIFSGNPAGSSTLYVDNVYFSTQNLNVVENVKKTFKVYPNPANETITVEADLTIDKIVLRNLLGQEVAVSHPAMTSKTVDISSLQAGIYLIEITVDGAISTKKFIKK